MLRSAGKPKPQVVAWDVAAAIAISFLDMPSSYGGERGGGGPVMV